MSMAKEIKALKKEAQAYRREIQRLTNALEEKVSLERDECLKIATTILDRLRRHDGAQNGALSTAEAIADGIRFRKRLAEYNRWENELARSK